MLLAAFPAHPRWGNLPLKPDFVPLILRLVSYAQHRPEAEAPPVVVADGTAEIAVNATWEPAEASVKDPDGLPEPLALERAGVRLLGAFEKTAKRGYYTVDVRGTRPDLLKAASLGFAVNLAPEESDFTLLKEEEIRKLLPENVNLTFIDASVRGTGHARQHRQGTRTVAVPHLDVVRHHRHRVLPLDGERPQARRRRGTDRDRAPWCR